MLQTNMWQAFLCLVSKDSHTPSTRPRFNKKDSTYANSQSCSEQTTSLSDIRWNLRSPRNFPGGKFSQFWRCQCYKGATSGSHMLWCLICLEDPNKSSFNLINDIDVWSFVTPDNSSDAWWYFTDATFYTLYKILSPWKLRYLLEALMNFYAPHSCLVLVLKFILWIFPEISLDSSSPRRAGNTHYKEN